MIDFLTSQGFYVYNNTTNDFKIIDNDQEILQRMTNSITVESSQWKIYPEAGLPWKELQSKRASFNTVQNTVTAQLKKDQNYTKIKSIKRYYENGVFSMNINIVINNTDYNINASTLL